VFVTEATGASTPSSRTQAAVEQVTDVDPLCGRRGALAEERQGLIWRMLLMLAKRRGTRNNKLLPAREARTSNACLTD